MVGDGMVTMVVHVKQGDLSAAGMVRAIADRSQSAHISFEASVMDAEQRERRKVDS